VPNFFLTVVEIFWYWGRLKVVLVFSMKSFFKVKFYNSSLMYVRYTVIVHPPHVQLIIPSRNTSHIPQVSPQQPKQFLLSKTIGNAPPQSSLEN
jgi:hypothetical protein